MAIRRESRRKFLTETTKKIATATLFPAFTAQAQLLDDAEEVSFYPTYGFREDNNWTVPVRAWVHEPRDVLEAAVVRAVARTARSFGDVAADELSNLRSRIANFFADSESRERIEIEFEADPERERFLIETHAGQALRTDDNGRMEGFIRLSDRKANELTARQQATNGWLAYKAVTDEHTGFGRVQLIDRIGRSVVSDVDDTIKVTEIPAGARVVVRNTFFRDFVAAPGMQERYAGLESAAFHYVSGGPWQLFEPLEDFLFPAYPAGSFHMKKIPTNLLSFESWVDLVEVAGPDATQNHKLHEIRTLLGHFPERSFILIGDSGEHDPEIYRRVRSEFPQQVEEVVIRDIVGLRNTNPEQLEGMTVIPAPTVVEGQSALDV
ncbi:MAG: phosphatidate phosphatase App1 family protein [Gammaproteobacteria bacterium]